jgi:hypothetical protein
MLLAMSQEESQPLCSPVGETIGKVRQKAMLCRQKAACVGFSADSVIQRHIIGESHPRLAYEVWARVLQLPQLKTRCVSSVELWLEWRRRPSMAHPLSVAMLMGVVAGVSRLA